MSLGGGASTTLQRAVQDRPLSPASLGPPLPKGFLHGLAVAGLKMSAPDALGGRLGPGDVVDLLIDLPGTAARRRVSGLRVLDVRETDRQPSTYTLVVAVGPAQLAVLGQRSSAALVLRTAGYLR